MKAMFFPAIIALALFVIYIIATRVAMRNRDGQNRIAGNGDAREKAHGRKNFLGQDDVIVSVEEHDQEMADAVAAAKRTFPFFVENWQGMKNDGYSVKFGLPTPDGGIEHIWFSPTKIEGDSITAECANFSEHVPDLNVGDIRELTADQVTDWMIMVGEKCYGGYTIKVLVERGELEPPPFRLVDVE